MSAIGWDAHRPLCLAIGGAVPPVRIISASSGDLEASAMIFAISCVNDPANEVWYEGDDGKGDKEPIGWHR